MGQQNIYSWTPKNEELKLISRGGPGTIKKMEFDHYTNNLYWIDPATSVIKLMNLDKRLKITLLEGNSTHTLHDFTLIPDYA